MNLKNLIFKGNVENYINRYNLKKLLKGLEVKDIELLVNCKLKGFGRIKLLTTLNILRVGHQMIYGEIHHLFTKEEWEYVENEIKNNNEKIKKKKEIKEIVFNL